MKLACTHALIGAVVVLGLGVLVSDSVTAAKFGEWSEPVNLGPLVNSPFDDISPHVIEEWAQPLLRVDAQYRVVRRRRHLDLQPRH